MHVLFQRKLSEDKEGPHSLGYAIIKYGIDGQSERSLRRDLRKWGFAHVCNAPGELLGTLWVVEVPKTVPRDVKGATLSDVLEAVRRAGGIRIVN